MYIVKSKTGKEYSFEELSAAEEFAKNKSTKTVCYCIYEGDRSIGAYRNKVRLPDWKTVYEEKIPKSFTKEEFYQQEKEIRERDPKVYIESHKQLVGLFIDRLEDKVRYRWVYNILACLRNGSHISKLHTKSVVFHSNGKVYFCDNGKVNFTYQPTDYMLTGSDRSMKRLAEELGKLRPEIKDMLIQYCLKYPLQEMFSKPTYVMSYDEHRKEFKPRNKIGLRFKYFPYELIDESKLADWICNKYKVPNTKGLHKLYCQELKNISIVENAKLCRFKDVNSIYKLAGLMRATADIKWVKPFCLKLIKLRGENRAASMMYDTTCSVIDDCVRMMQYTSDEAIAYIFKNAKNVEEIHDSLIAASDTSKLKNEQIVYKPKEEKLYNHKYGNVVFQLAKDTKELAVIGAEMGICVGSYGDAAVSRRTTIVKMLDGEKYIACIEIHNNILVQLKAKFNNPVKIEYKEYVDKWIKDTGLKFKSCCDYEMIGSPWKSTYNHATIRPERYNEDKQPKLQIIKAEHVPHRHLSTWYEKEDKSLIYTIKLSPFNIAKQAELIYSSPTGRKTVDWSIVKDIRISKETQEKRDRQYVFYGADELPFDPVF